MSWSKLFGDLAKDYIRENGVKGTMEDLGSLASGIKGFFSSDDDYSDDDSSDDDSSDDENIWEPYNEFLEQERYQAAMDYVKRVYSGQEKDYIYHYYIGNTYSLMGEYGKAINQLQQSYSKCPKNTDDANVIKEKLDFAKHRNEYQKAWKTLLTDLEKLRNNKEFNEAIRQLDKFYNKYDNGQKDIYYWEQMFEIHNCQEFTKEDVFARNDRTLQLDLNKMRELANEDTYETLTSMETRINYFNYQLKIGRLSSKKQFDIIKIEIEKWFGSDSNKEINESYWSSIVYNYIYALESNVLVGNSREEDLDNANKALNQYSRIIKTYEDEEIREICEDEIKDLCQRLENLKSIKPIVISAPEKTSQKNGSESTSDSEKEYKDEILACLADDGEISDRERRLLDKLRKSLGISEERAMQIETECKNNGMSENELEYLEELRACLTDGEISEKEERLLQRLRKSLGISEDRELEIRNMLK